MIRYPLRFEPHPATKQTKEIVSGELESAARLSKTGLRCNTLLTILYGNLCGPALFVFINGACKRIKPFKGYSRPKDIVFAITEESTA